jgi:hypothetical protein
VSDARWALFAFPAMDAFTGTALIGSLHDVRP